jgi:hypothetical protein
MKNPRQEPWSPTANRHRYALIGKTTVHVGGADSNDPIHFPPAGQWENHDYKNPEI